MCAIKFTEESPDQVDHVWKPEEEAFNYYIKSLFETTANNLDKKVNKERTKNIDSWSLLMNLYQTYPAETAELIRELDATNKDKISPDDLMEFAGADFVRECSLLQSVRGKSDSVPASSIYDLSYRILKTLDSYLESKPKLNLSLPPRQGPYR